MPKTGCSCDKNELFSKIMASFILSECTISHVIHTVYDDFAVILFAGNVIKQFHSIISCNFAWYIIMHCA